MDKPSSKPQSQNTELWMEVIQEDLPLVKKALARRVLLPNLNGKEGMRGYARLLLHQLSKQGLRIPAGGAPPRFCEREALGEQHSGCYN